MRWRFASLGVSLLILTSVVVPRPTVAQTRSSATEVYLEAQKLFDKGQYAEALVAFRQAYNASSSPNARLMVGHCLIALGKTSEAYIELTETLQEATNRSATEPKYKKTMASASDQLALLEGKVAKIQLVLKESAIEITINGSRVAPDKLGTAIAVDPGTAVLSAKHADGRTTTKQQVVEAGKTIQITLTFAPTNGPTSTTDPKNNLQSTNQSTTPLPDNPSEPAKSGGTRIAGGVLLGVGVAGTAVLGVSLIMARSTFQTLETECGGVRCTDAKYADVVDRGKSLTIAANVGLGVGIAGIVGGTLMLLLGGSSKTPPPATIAISPSGAAVQCRMTF